MVAAGTQGAGAYENGHWRGIRLEILIELIDEVFTRLDTDIGA